MERAFALNFAEDAVRGAGEVMRRLEDIGDLFRDGNGENEEITLPHVQSIIEFSWRTGCEAADAGISDTFVNHFCCINGWHRHWNRDLKSSAGNIELMIGAIQWITKSIGGNRWRGPIHGPAIDSRYLVAFSQ